jgi:hypothetical protein
MPWQMVKLPTVIIAFDGGELMGAAVCTGFLMRDGCSKKAGMLQAGDEFKNGKKVEAVVEGDNLDFFLNVEGSEDANPAESSADAESA